MSERSKELALRVVRIAVNEASQDLRVRRGIDTIIGETAALIDAELRKERERAMERAVSLIGDYIGYNRRLELRAAILTDDEADR